MYSRTSATFFRVSTPDSNSLQGKYRREGDEGEGGGGRRGEEGEKGRRGCMEEMVCMTVHYRPLQFLV